MFFGESTGIRYAQNPAPARENVAKDEDEGKRDSSFIELEREKKGLAKDSATVLVVDDEKLIRWSLNERLLESGYHVLLAENGRTALEWFEDGLCVDAILLDLKLPDVDGLDLLRRFREKSVCPVILMSAYGSPERIDEGMSLGAATFIPKPFDLDEMVRAVGAVLKPA